MIKRIIKCLFILGVIFNINCMQKDKKIDLVNLKVKNLDKDDKINIYFTANLLIYQNFILNLLKNLDPIINDLFENSEEDSKFLSYYLVPNSEEISDLYSQIIEKKEINNSEIEKFKIDEPIEEVKDLKQRVEKYLTESHKLNKDSIIVYSTEALLLFAKLKRNFENNDKPLIINYLNKYKFLLKLKNSTSEIFSKNFFQKDFDLLVKSQLKKVEKDIIFYSLKECLITPLVIFMQITDQVKNLPCINNNVFLEDENTDKLKINFINNFINFLDNNDLYLLKDNHPDFIPFIKKVSLLSNYIESLDAQELKANKYRMPSKNELNIIKRFVQEILKDKKTISNKSKNLYSKIKKIDIKFKNNDHLQTYCKYLGLPTKVIIDSDKIKQFIFKNPILPSTLSTKDKSFVNCLNYFLGFEIDLKDKSKTKQDEGWLDFLNKNNYQKSITIKNKQKKSRRRPSKKECNEELNQEETEEKLKSNLKKDNNYEEENIYENINLPFYHERILKWFDSKFQEDKEKFSVLYHTYCPIVDLIIKKYGKCKFRNSINKDVAYYQEGAIRFNDGEFKPAIFVNCYNKYGICYHRGIETKQSQEIFKEITEDNIIFNFPKEEIEKNLKGYRFTLRDNYNIYDIKEFKENDFCIYINDIKNQANLIIFK